LLVPPAGSQTAARAAAIQTPSLTEGLTTKDVYYHSEGIRCHGKIFMPRGFSATSNAPAVVLAPGWAQTAPSIEKYGARFASRGLVAMVIDYRGWGKSGGFPQTVDQVKTDDRLRFSQMTAKVLIRRKRLIPQHQILDIRNALYYIQGEPGVDRARLGVWGVDMAGGHMVVVAATDARIKAVVAHTPVIDGKEMPRKASAPTGELLLAELMRARGSRSPSAVAGAGTSEPVETRLALAEYHPFWKVEQIPQTTAVLFVVAENDTRVKNEMHAIAAAKLLKGATIINIAGATQKSIHTGKAFDTAAGAAADWFLKHL
jgi:hypothetical protein